MSDKKIYLDSVLAYREDVLANWEYSNPVLEKGEPSIVRDGTDGNWLKIGDGVTAWNDLPYKKGPKGEQGPRGERGEQGLPGKDGNNYILTIDDKEEIANMAKGNVDQTYSPESENAQSGKAVAQALATVNEKWEFIEEIVFAEDATIARIDNLLTGQQYREYKKLFIDFYIALATEKTVSLRFTPRNLIGGGFGVWTITPSYKFSTNGFRNGSLYEERIDTQNGEKITRWFSTIVDSQVGQSQFVSQGVMRFEAANWSDIYQLSITPSISEDIPFLAGTYFKVYGVK